MSPPCSKTASRSASPKSPASPSTPSHPTPPEPFPPTPCDWLRIVAHHTHLSPVQALHRLSSGKFHPELKRVSLMLKLSKHLVCAVLALALALPAGAAQAPADPAEAALQSIRPETIRSHMNFLADDLLEGRGTDSRGYE